MPFLISQAIEVRPAKAEILPDERKRLTRFVSWKQNSELPLQLTYSYGDVDVFANPPTGWDGLRLIDAQSDYSLSNNGAGNDPIIRLTYEQISATGETQVGGTETTVLEDGRVSKTLTFIQFSNVVYTPTAAGTAGEGGFLISEVANDNGSVRTIRRTYVESGLLAQVDETKNNGKLLIRTLTYAITTPPTPSGYTLISQNVRGPDGYQILTYTFAKGDGEISRDETYRQSVNQGSTGLTFITIRHLTASSVSSNPITTPSGFILSGVEHVDQDGYRVWTGSYARGTGTVINDVTGRSDGSIAYVVTTLSATATTPSNPSGGTAYLTDLTNAIGDGFYTNRAVYIKLPATVTLKQPFTFNMPGTAIFDTGLGGDNLLLSPSKQIPLLADAEVSYDTTQLDTAHYFVEFGVYYQLAFVREGQTAGEFIDQSFSNYVSSGGSVSGTAPDAFNGIVCESYSASLSASSPTARPSGLTVIAAPQNEIYLTATDGTVIYRRTVLTYTF